MVSFVFFSGKEPGPLNLPFYLWILNVVALILVPLSFAYAVVKHRVMDIPVLLKRSARYLLVRRGFALAITFASMGVAWVFVRFFFQFFPWLHSSGNGAVVTIGMAGAGVGGLIAVGTSRIQDGVRHRLDRAFFRGQYDARQILEDLAVRIRTIQKTTQLATLLEEQIIKALHPSALTLYVEVADGLLQTAADGVHSELRQLTSDHDVLRPGALLWRPLRRSRSVHVWMSRVCARSRDVGERGNAVALVHPLLAGCSDLQFSRNWRGQAGRELVKEFGGLTTQHRPRHKLIVGGFWSNAARLLFALWYLLGSLSHVWFELTNNYIYQIFGRTSIFAISQELWVSVVMPHITFFALLLAVFEMTTGVLILSKGKLVWIGLTASVLFNLFLVQLGLGFPEVVGSGRDFLLNRFSCSLFAVLQLPLFWVTFDLSLPEFLRARLRSRSAIAHHRLLDD